MGESDSGKRDSSPMARLALRSSHGRSVRHEAAAVLSPNQTAPGPLAAALAAQDLEPGSMVGDYRIEAKIADGGMSTVYSAIHPVIGKRVAVKVMIPQLCLDGGAIERFVREARAVNQIGHANIVDVFAFGALPDGRSYFVMEWLPGETLGARLKRERPTLGETAEILLQVCEALEAAHGHSIVHRDLKPDNIFLVSGRGKLPVKLLDFGLAKLTGAPSGPSQHTENAMFVGTPTYMSPEQARSKGVDYRTDLYALGVTAYEMILGRPPFVGETAMDVLHLHIGTPPPPPSTLWPAVPPEVERMLLALLDKDPERRPSLADVVAWLRWLHQRPAPAPEVEEAPRSASRRRYVALAAAAMIVAAAVLAGVRLRARSPAPTAAAVIPPAPAITSRPAIASAPAAANASTRAPSIAPRPGVLALEINVPARITLDGNLVAAQAAHAEIPVASAGEHKLLISAPHYRSLKSVVVTTPGARVELPVTLERAVAAPGTVAKPATRPPRKNYLIDPFAGKP